MIEELIKHVLGVIIISHNIEHVIKVADRVIVLRNGSRAGSLDFKDYSNDYDRLHNDIVKMITGAEFIDYIKRS